MNAAGLAVLFSLSPLLGKGQGVVETPRFVVMSDVHFGNTKGVGPMIKVPKALKNLLGKTPAADAIFIVGDLTDSGTAAQYTQLKTVFNDKANIPDGVEAYYLMGNHDFYPSDKELAKNNYLTLGQPLHQYIKIKGYPFITISMNSSGNSGSNLYDATAKQFLTDSLARAAQDYPGKPIFVFIHVAPKNTVYGSYANDGNWATDDFSDILKKYPQVIVFSGHSHYSLRDPRSIHQGDYTAINDGSSTYSEIEPNSVNVGIHPEKYDNITEGLIVNVRANGDVNMERWDTYRNEEMLPQWNIKAPHDGTQFSYKGRNGMPPPAFAVGAVPVVTKTAATTCNVTFPQANDNELVHHYLITIKEGTQTVASFSKFSQFYLNSQMPQTLTVTFSELPGGASLVAEVTAIDSYGNASAPMVSAPFTTEVVQVVRPVADILDVVFGENGEAQDISPLRNTIISGSTKPTTASNATYNRQSALFSGINTCYYRVDYAGNQVIKDAFTNGFTFEILYKTNSTGSTFSPMSAQESGGAGFEHPSGGQAQFWAHIGGGYKTIKSARSVATNQYYHEVGVYDKVAGKLRLYLDGQDAGSMDVSGAFGFPNNSAAHWIAIGGDANTGSTAQSPLNGEVVIARMYGKALSYDEVRLLYSSLTEPQGNSLPAIQGIQGKSLLRNLWGVPVDTTSNLPAGVYLLTSGGQTKKVIVNK
ncbi:MAG: 5'-cyclic adenosine monophosphate phosphodiesterase CpdA [Candidatus Ordinivivax streblomastigis]|uniref:5'-cyclic adenosine monophosphate phosphodiesterase CpdA n=1 Tax=Candidatus Ordinivivax streblomastigis TaxID=2540710 RepID=A0A5M8P2S0_9BACT|nr:MAG: 5'-cyclic adenosine monophosphate phosphodiesterase CpdA [Candidatus Ordinivivax streblomastigis]